MPKSDDIQFKFRIDPAMHERLEQLAKKCGLGTANKFAFVALDNYAEILADLIIKDRAAHRERIQRHHEELLGKDSQESKPSRRK